jgi:hypothetical protein
MNMLNKMSSKGSLVLRFLPMGVTPELGMLGVPRQEGK